MLNKIKTNLEQLWYRRRYRRALVLFDMANGQDPKQEFGEGKYHPRELLYAQRMSQCLQEFEAKASLNLRLAVRAQHICRWKIDRSQYPQGRSGYLRWRSHLYKFHAEQAGEILKQVAYPKKDIERVQFLISKKGLRYDAEAQILEDVVCLVFLRYYLLDFSKKHDEEKVKEILRKTWEKMSPRGRKASSHFSLAPPNKLLLEQAIQ